MAKDANLSTTSHLHLVPSSDFVSIQVPLPLLGALQSAKQGFAELCFDAGFHVVCGMMERDRETLCGPKGRHDPDRRASRAGSAPSRLTFGGRQVGIERPRVRSRDGQELALPSFGYFTQRDPLDARTLEAIACGVSSRKYRRHLESLPAGVKESSVSKSAVSRRFVVLSQKQVRERLAAPLSDFDVRIVIVDGIVLHEHTVLIALGIDSDGRKRVLGLREGSTESEAVAKALLRELIERGLPTDRAVLFILDGSKALRSAARKVFGSRAVFHRCQVHKRRNVLEHLPERMQPSVKRLLEEAWSGSDASLAKRRLEQLATSLEREHPGAAASVREGLEETLTLQKLGVDPRGALYRTLRSTNPIENLNGSIGVYARNVKRWNGGSMVQRWVASALTEAETRFRKLRGHRELAALFRTLQTFDAEQKTATAQRVA